MKLRLLLLVVNLAVFSAWLGRMGWDGTWSWPDGN
jgi:hypothetical protein